MHKLLEDYHLLHTYLHPLKPSELVFPDAVSNRTVAPIGFYQLSEDGCFYPRIPWLKFPQIEPYNLSFLLGFFGEDKA